MSLRKIWPRWPLEPWSRRAWAVSARLLVFVLLVGLCLHGAPGRAEATIQITLRQERYVFSESLHFVIEARAEEPIVEAILFYGLEGSRLVRRIYPRFRSGLQVRVEHTEELESGQFAPGVKIVSWWRLRTEGGTVLETDPATFEYNDDNHDWRLLSDQQVDLFWYGNSEAKARELLERAEEALDRLQREMGVSLERRVRIYVYNSERDMRRALSRRSAGYDEMVTTLGVSVGENTLLLLGSHRDVAQTVAHELSHIVVKLATQNPYTDLPRWLDEGLAMYAEGKLPVDNQRALERAIREDKLISLRSMTSYSGRASEVDLFYGQAYSVVAFLLKEYGPDKMRELLQVFAEGTLQEEALHRVYGFGLAELETRWRASLGLGPRGSATPFLVTSASPTVEATRSPVGARRACFSSFGALLLPLMGIGVAFWVKGLQRVG